MSWFSRHYNHWAVLRPWPLLIALLLVLMVLGWHARDFRLDASADSLLLENDEDYKVFRDLSERYQSKSFLVVALVPEQGVFATSTLKRVGQLLKRFPGSVQSSHCLMCRCSRREKDR